MKRFSVKNFGPIGKVDLEFGDLTFLVGAQASGKSMFLELLKLIEDRNAIIANLNKYNFIISKKDPNSLLDIYFGHGMSNAWNNETAIRYDNSEYNSKVTLLKKEDEEKEEKVFYIPAQRILSISDGRPKAFSEFDPTSPYVLRQFSEILRIFMSSGIGGNTVLFPISTRFKKVSWSSFDNSIFHGGRVEMANENGQRKMHLKVDGMDMPFMTWSAGQKEFMPLLMGFYCVSGPPMHILNKDRYRYVIIEEPEMGLHPQAIMAVLFQTLELVQSGYKVIISTHSTVPLEFAWAFNMIKDKIGAEKALMNLFDSSAQDAGFLSGIFNKNIRTYSFSRTASGKVESTDISSLDAFDKNREISEWGGLSDFASRASDLVSRYCND